MDKLFLAHSFFKRHKYEECISLCTQLLEHNPLDQVLFSNLLYTIYLKKIYLTLKKCMHAKQT